jgi:hypothetical protein
MTAQTWSTPGDYLFTVPANVRSLQIEAWQSGAGGNLPSGGGGGAYGRRNAYSVTPGDVLSINIPSGGAGSSTDGTGSSGSYPEITKNPDGLGEILLGLGHGGGSVPGGGSSLAGGAGGVFLGEPIAFDVAFHGGSGYAGGGGGSSAGTAANGNDATNDVGASAPTGGAAGGSTGLDIPTNGSSPGGGGGGNVNEGGADGGDGKVVFTYSEDINGVTKTFDTLETEDWIIPVGVTSIIAEATGPGQNGNGPNIIPGSGGDNGITQGGSGSEDGTGNPGTTGFAQIGSSNYGTPGTYTVGIALNDSITIAGSGGHGANAGGGSGGRIVMHVDQDSYSGSPTGSLVIGDVGQDTVLTIDGDTYTTGCGQDASGNVPGVGGSYNFGSTSGLIDDGSGSGQDGTELIAQGGDGGYGGSWVRRAYPTTPGKVVRVTRDSDYTRIIYDPDGASVTLIQAGPGADIFVDSVADIYEGGTGGSASDSLGGGGGMPSSASGHGDDGASGITDSGNDGAAGVDPGQGGDGAGAFATNGGDGALGFAVITYESPVSGSVVLDFPTSSGYQESATNASWTNECGDNALLIVSVAVIGGTQSVTGITAMDESENTTALSLICSKTSSGLYTIEMWGTDPAIPLPAGNYTISVTLSAGIDFIAIAQSVTNEDSSPLVNASVANAVTVDIAADGPGLIIGAISSDDGSVGVGAGQIQRANIGGRYGSSVLSTELVTAPGTVTTDFTGVVGGAQKAVAAVFIRGVADEGGESESESESESGGASSMCMILLMGGM